MKKLFITICAVCLLMTGCGADGHNRLNTSIPKFDRTFIIGLDDDYAPMCFRSSQGELVGFDVDLAKRTAKIMGVNVEFKAIDWTKKVDELNAGNIDMIWSGMDITDERKAVMLFSAPYMTNSQILLVNKGNTQGISSAADLAGKIVGTRAGSTAEIYVNKLEELKNTFAGFKTYLDFQTGLQALDNGEIDVLIIDEIVGRYGMAREPNRFEVLNVAIGEATEFGIGFRKDDTALRDEVQAAFDKLVEDGTAQKISKQWFDADLIKVHR